MKQGFEVFGVRGSGVSLIYLGSILVKSFALGLGDDLLGCSIFFFCVLLSIFVPSLYGLLCLHTFCKLATLNLLGLFMS